MEYWNTAILIGAALLVISIVASVISTRAGVPLLLVFLVLGMLAGEDGPGGIEFDDFETAYVIGSLALAQAEMNDLLVHGLRLVKRARLELRQAADAVHIGSLAGPLRLAVGAERER